MKKNKLQAFFKGYRECVLFHINGTPPSQILDYPSSYSKGYNKAYEDIGKLADVNNVPDMVENWLSNDINEMEVSLLTLAGRIQGSVEALLHANNKSIAQHNQRMEKLRLKKKAAVAKSKQVDWKPIVSETTFNDGQSYWLMTWEHKNPIIGIYSEVDICFLTGIEEDVEINHVDFYAPMQLPPMPSEEKEVGDE